MNFRRTVSLAAGYAKICHKVVAPRKNLMYNVAVKIWAQARNLEENNHV